MKGKSYEVLWGKEGAEELKKKRREGRIKYFDKIGRKQHRRSYHPSSDKKYLNWRISVFERDGYGCQICEKIGGLLQVHHIKSWAKYPELRYVVDNGITLCLDCHKKTDNYGNKKECELNKQSVQEN
jgi:5-methylcytosine-specific restriction endonuclease McrA